MKKLLLALRVVRNYRLYTIVNVLGLALSLACVITISRYLYSELTVDSMHSKRANIYAVMSSEQNSLVRRISAAVNHNKRSDFVDIAADAAVMAKTIVLFGENENIVSQNQDYAADILVVDSSFTKIFDFTTKIGSLQDVEKSVDKAAITARMARRMFGSEDPLGKTITVKQRNYTVVAILDEPTSKTTIKFDMVLPMGDWRSWMLMENQFLLMPDNFDYAAFNDKYNVYWSPYSEDVKRRLSVTPFSDLYFDTSYDMYWSKMWLRGDLASLRVIFVVAVFMLLIGVFNFVNIYTVLMLRRSREVGVKKVFGASTASITGGIYTENLVMVLLAVVIGWMVAASCAEFAASSLGIPIIENLRFDIALSASLIVILPLLTTIYPYFKYRYAKPITSLKNLTNTNRSVGPRAVILVVQYAITIIMVIVSVYFVRQLSFLLNADLGYTHKDIISAQLFVDKEAMVFKEGTWEEKKKRRAEIAARGKLLRDKLAQSPVVKSFSYNEPPHTIRPAEEYWLAKSSGKEANTSIYGCGAQFFSMYGIDKVAGRLWSDSTDTFTQYYAVVNETFLRELGITDYSTASIQLNRRIWYNSDGDMSVNPPYTIVGVIKDFKIGHLSNKPSPLIIYYSESDGIDDIDPTRGRLNVQAVEGKTEEVIALLGELHKELGNGEFSYTLIDDEIAAQYAEDRKVTNIYTTFAIIAIIIGSLGLFSLSLYDVQQRYREIALRRVNGARVGQIIMMLLRKYYLLLSISFVIAIPVAWWAIDWYMQDFATRSPISWWIFALAALLTAAISLLTLIYQTARAARTNPAEAMKSE